MFQRAKRKYKFIERTNNERLGFFSCIQSSEHFYIALSLCLVYIANCYSCDMNFFFQRKMLDPEKGILKIKSKSKKKDKKEITQLYPSEPPSLLLLGDFPPQAK